MSIPQHILFAWISAWVLCESVFPGMSYAAKLETCILCVFVAGYTHNAHGVLWGKLRGGVQRIKSNTR